MHAFPCPASHQLIATTLPHFQMSEGDQDDQGSRNELCLTCFLTDLQSSNTTNRSDSVMSLQRVQHTTVAMLTELTQRCPTDQNSENAEAFRLWALANLDPTRPPRSGQASNRAALVDGRASVGPVLADIVMALYHYLVTSTNAAVHCDGAGSIARAAVAELATFVFAGWEVLEACETSAPAPQVAEDTAATDTTVHHCELLGADSLDESTPSPCHTTNTNTHHNTLHNPEDALSRCQAAITSVMQEVTDSLLDALLSLDRLPEETSGIAATAELPLRAMQSHTAVSMLATMAQQSALLTRALRSPDHVCALARDALPFCMHLAATQQQQQRSAPGSMRPGNDYGGSQREPCDTLQTLLELLHHLLLPSRYCSGDSYSPSDNAGISDADVAARLHLQSWAVHRQAHGDVALLISLHRLLQSPRPRVTPLVLALLQEAMRWPATQQRLVDVFDSAPFSTSPFIFPGAALPPSPNEGCAHYPQRQQWVVGEETERQSAAPPFSFHSPSSLDFAVVISPLLLSHSGDVVLRASAVLTALLDSPVRSNAALAAAERAAAVAVARHIEGYVMSAVRVCVEEKKKTLCAALVNLLELVAVVLEAATADGVRFSTVPQNAATAADWAADGVAADSWQVVFLVAQLDARLFERLVCGTVFHRTLRRQQQQQQQVSASRVGVDWNMVVAAVLREVVGNGDGGGAAPVLTLHGYLCLLKALSAHMGAAMACVWSEALGSLMTELTTRLHGHMTAAGYTYESDSAVLTSLLEPCTHELLIQVVAAYQPYAKAAVQDVALRVLKDLVITHRLAASRYCETVAHYSSSVNNNNNPSLLKEAEVAESACLLRMAAALVQQHQDKVSALCQFRSAFSSHGISGNAVDGCCPCTTLHTGGALPLSTLHELFTPLRDTAAERDGGMADDASALDVVGRGGLFEVLLHLQCDAPALVEERRQWLEAVIGTTLLPSQGVTACRTSSYHEPYTGIRSIHNANGSTVTTTCSASHGVDCAATPLAYVGAASLPSVLDTCGPDVSARLLLGLTGWTAVPAIAKTQVVKLTQSAAQALLDQLWSTERTMSGEQAAHLVTPVPQGHETEAAEAALLETLRQLLCFVMVHVRWWGQLPAVCFAECTAQSDADDDAPTPTARRKVTGRRVQTALRALMASAANSAGLRRGVCLFLFSVAVQHRVCVRSLLMLLSDGQPIMKGHLFAGLGAVLMLCAVLHRGDIGGCRSDDAWNAGRASDAGEEGNEEMDTVEDEEEEEPPRMLAPFLATLAAQHWLSEHFRVWCDHPRWATATATTTTVSNNIHSYPQGQRAATQESSLGVKVAFAGQLLLTTLFHCIGKSQDGYGGALSQGHTGLAGPPSAASREWRLVMRAVRYVVAESTHQLAQLRRERRGEGETLFSLATRTCPVLAGGVGCRVYFRVLLSKCLCPSIAASLLARSQVLHASSAADEVDMRVMQLCCMALWALASTDESACDGTLAHYAVLRARRCLGLINAGKCVFPRSPELDDEEEAAAAVAEGADKENASNKRRHGHGGGKAGATVSRLVFWTLQLIYLLLMRSNREAVASADTAVLMLFAKAAQTLSAGSISARACDGTVDIHVLAVLVQLYVSKTLPWYHPADNLLLPVGSHGLADFGPSISSISGGGGGQAWYERIDLAMFREEPSRLVTSARYRRRVWVLLTGVEAVLRVCRPPPISDPPLRETPAECGARVNDAGREKEWCVVCQLLDWCYAVLVPHSTTIHFALEGCGSAYDRDEDDDDGVSDDENATYYDDHGVKGGDIIHHDGEPLLEDGADVMTVAARLLFLLVRQCPALLATTGALDAFFISYCSGLAAVSSAASVSRHRHVVAEGWVLTALLDILFHFPHWSLYARMVEMQVLKFLELPEVVRHLKAISAARALQLQTGTHPSSSSSLPLSAAVAAEGGEEEDSSCNPDSPPRNAELELLLFTLTDVIRSYESNAQRYGRLSVDSGKPLLPLGMQLPAVTDTVEYYSTRWWTTYTVPNSVAGRGRLPLLLVYNHFFS